MWSQLHPLLGDRRRSIAVLAVGSVLSGVTEAGILAILAQVAASLVEGASQVSVNVGPLHIQETIGAFLVIAFVLSLIRLALQVLISILPAQIAANLQAQLRRDLFAVFTRTSWAVQSRDREGHLQEMVTEQITQATLGALLATTLVSAILTFFVLVISALALNIVAAFTVLIVATGLFALLQPMSTLGGHQGRALSLAQMNYASGVNEAVRLAAETQVFGVGSAQRDLLNRLVDTARTHFFHTQLLARLAPALYQSLIYILIVAAFGVLYVIDSGHVASLGAVVLLLVRAGTYGQQAQGAYQVVRQASPYLDRLNDAASRYAASSPTAGKLPLSTVQTITFEHVYFAYEPNQPILSDICFEVVGGQTIGIVGPSGAGKSTLVEIVLGLRAPNCGRYLINGLPADQFAPDDWHRRVAYVPQEPRLLHNSVAENIRFFRNLDDNAVQRAARLAGIHDDVMKWSEGYNTIIGPRADAVSGGQQQRLCLARALAAKPQVLILDEPTSALDSHSEQLIQASLAALKSKCTLFIVAHRLSTLDICERVMILIDGRLEAFDKADTLRSSSAYYRSALVVASPGEESS